MIKSVCFSGNIVYDNCKLSVSGEISQMISNKKTSVSGNEIAVDLSVTLGTADLRVQQLLKLGRGAVVELDRDINDYVDIYANDVLIGRGEVVITENDSIGIAVTEVIKKKPD